MVQISQSIIELKNSGMTHKAIVEKLGCSISTVSYHCKKAGLGDTTGKYASPTEKEKLEFQRLYDEGRTILQVSNIVGWNRHAVAKYLKLRPSRTVEENKKVMVLIVSERRRAMKAKAIEYKGGKCVKCGYNKCVAAMEFHHIDPTQKDIRLARDTNWERMKSELDKCILVCSNCHREIHHELKYENTHRSLRKRRTKQ